MTASDPRLAEVLDTIIRLANGDFTVRLKHESSPDPLDGIAAGLNMLAEELSATTVSRNALSTLFDSMAHSLIVTDRSGSITLANQAAAQLLGVEKNHLMGVGLRDICPEFFLKDSTWWAHVFETGQTHPFEIPFRSLKGEEIPVLLAVTTLNEIREGHVSLVFSAQDLRPVKDLQKTLEKAESQLLHAARMAAIGEMAGGIAHEINNPLAIIQSRAGQLREMFERGQMDPAFVIKAAERIEATVQRIARIIRGLRTIAREPSGECFELASLQKLLSDALDLCGERFRHHGVRLEVRLPEDGIQIECRPIQISQVLLNLLNNAFDAVSAFEQPWVEVAIDIRENGVEISVSDCGAGIPEDIRDRVMLPFFSTKEVGKGTGLGLSISKGIVESHGGEIFVDASADHTRFVIHLPLQQTAREPSAA